MGNTVRPDYNFLNFLGYTTGYTARGVSSPSHPEKPEGRILPFLLDIGALPTCG